MVGGKYLSIYTYLQFIRLTIFNNLLATFTVVDCGGGTVEIYAFFQPDRVSFMELQMSGQALRSNPACGTWA